MTKWVYLYFLTFTKWILFWNFYKKYSERFHYDFNQSLLISSEKSAQRNPRSSELLKNGISHQEWRSTTFISTTSHICVFNQREEQIVFEFRIYDRIFRSIKTWLNGTERKKIPHFHLYNISLFFGSSITHPHSRNH